MYYNLFQLRELYELKVVVFGALSKNIGKKTKSVWPKPGRCGSPIVL